MSRTDVIILGGGIIGCALAEELARRGRRVLVVERRSVGAEASTAAAGILSAQMDLPEPGPLFELCQAARRLYPRWVAYLERRAGVSVDFHVDGILAVALTRGEERAFARQARWQRRRGLAVERWSPAQVRRKEPAVDGRLRCGFVFPSEAQVENVRLMEALAVACRRAGVQVREQTAVSALRIQAGAVRGVVTDKGELSAPVVVNCLGSWAGAVGRFPVPLPVEPARGQMLAFDGARRLLRRAVMSSRAYAVQRRDGRLILGSTIERAGFEKTLTVEGMHAILCGAHRLISALKSCTFLDAWAGFRPLTPDGLPILGATPAQGLYVATGHFRHGILLAPITASLMADLILTGRSPFDLLPFSPARFSRYQGQTWV